MYFCAVSIIKNGSFGRFSRGLKLYEKRRYRCIFGRSDLNWKKRRERKTHRESWICRFVLIGEMRKAIHIHREAIGFGVRELQAVRLIIRDWDFLGIHFGEHARRAESIWIFLIYWGRRFQQLFGGERKATDTPENPMEQYQQDNQEKDPLTDTHQLWISCHFFPPSVREERERERKTKYTTACVLNWSVVAFHHLIHWPKSQKHISIGQFWWIKLPTPMHRGTNSREW